MIKTRVPNGDVESISVKISKAFGISNLAEAIDKHELIDESALPMEDEMLDLTEGEETPGLISIEYFKGQTTNFLCLN